MLNELFILVDGRAFVYGRIDRIDGKFYQIFLST